MIALITEWQDQKGTVEQRTEKSDMGGTMRLGAQEVRLVARLAGARDLRRGRDHASATAIATSSTTATCSS